MAFNGRRIGKKNTTSSSSVNGIFSLREHHIAAVANEWIGKTLSSDITITSLGTTVTQSSDNVTGIDLSSVSVNDMLILVYGSEGAYNVTNATLAGTSVSIDVEETGSATYPTVAIMSIKADADIAGNASATLAITTELSATDYRAAVSVFKLSEEVANSTRTYSVSEAGTSASSNIDFSEGVLFAAYFDEDDSAPTLVGVDNTIDEDMGSGSSDFFIGYSPESSSGSGTHSVGYSSGAADGTAFAAAVYRSGTWLVPVNLPADAVLYISGEGGISDTGPNSYTVSNAGGASHETSVVKVGTGAIAFDGSNTAYIYVSGQTFIDDSLSSWQFQCWARNSGTIPGTGDTGQLIDQYQSSEAGRMIFGFQDNGIDLRINGGDIYLTSGDILSGDTWYHVCLNYDGTTHRLFIDGDLKDSSTTVPTIYTGVDTGFGGGGSLSGYDLSGWTIF